ncbi:MAG TPA: molybdopterin-dependent oxidoreductase [Puia sp.]|jgi:DMSO/TMAO reductase YedYZ molybdopterin-dependent catalytic subunit
MRILLLAGALLFVQLTTTAQSVTVGGEVLTPLTLTATDLTAMPRTTAVSKDKQGNPHSFEGVALADIFKKAGVTTGRDLRGENLAKYVLITCADNYQIVFSLAELDSSFTDRVVILADKMEDKPLPAGVGPFRIVVPGEKKPARNCFQVVSIDVKFAKK